MNKNQCVRKHYLNQQLKVVPSQYSLYNCLVDMGHQVEQKVVSLGEDISTYDKVIVYVADPKQLVAINVYNGLYAISQRPDCIIAFDDWQLVSIYKGILDCENDSKLFCDFIMNNQYAINSLDVEKYKDQIKNGVKQIIKKENKILLSVFSTLHLKDENNYGKKLLFNELGYDLEKVFTYNPNPYHRNRKPGDFSNNGVEDPNYQEESNIFGIQTYNRPTKIKQFNFASLVQSLTEKWLKKQGFCFNKTDDEKGFINSWPVELYGSKSKSQKRLTEEEMCKVYDENWATLMPGYFHSGSGWWRARPLQVADCESILIGDKKELEVYYGKDFKYNNITAKELTQLSDDELKKIALAQKEAIYKNHPLNKNVQSEEINLILK